MSGSRKSLGVIQVCNSDRVDLSTKPVKPAMVRGDENACLVSNKPKSLSHQSVLIFQDPPAATPVQKCDTGAQTECTGCCSCSQDQSQVATSSKMLDLDHRLVSQDEAPAEYWQIFAERRREALEDALEENKKVHDQNEKLLAENERLKIELNQLQEDNAQLLELAKDAEYFANLLKKLTDEGDDKKASRPNLTKRNDSVDCTTLAADV